jgi:acetolactate synthase small subunit
MTPSGFLVRVQDQKGALERVLGVLRRKALKVSPVSISRGPKGLMEVFLKTTHPALPSHRVEPELASLTDVLEVQELGETGPLITRELALMRVSPGSKPFLPEGTRIVGTHPEGDLLEFTGTSNEVDAALTSLAGQRVLTAFRRTGEVPAPTRPTQTEGVREG